MYLLKKAFLKKMFRQISHFFETVDKVIHIIHMIPYTISDDIHKLITDYPPLTVNKRTVVLNKTI